MLQKSGNTPAIAGHESWTKAGPVVSHLADATLETLEERAVATIGGSSPLGLWGFATGTWIAAVIIGGLLPFGDMNAVAPIALLFAGVAQFIAVLDLPGMGTNIALEKHLDR